MRHDPAATAVTPTLYAFAVAPDLIFTTTTSVAAIALLVNVKLTAVSRLSVALFIVISPQTLSSVTPVDLLVA